MMEKVRCRVGTRAGVQAGLLWRKARLPGSASACAHACRWPSGTYLPSASHLSSSSPHTAREVFRKAGSQCLPVHMHASAKQLGLLVGTRGKHGKAVRASFVGTRGKHGKAVRASFVGTRGKHGKAVRASFVGTRGKHMANMTQGLPCAQKEAFQARQCVSAAITEWGGFMQAQVKMNAHLAKTDRSPCMALQSCTVKFQFNQAFAVMQTLLGAYEH